MLHIVFKFKDRYTNGEWHTQECHCSSVSKAIEFYGLGVDCEYEIVSVEEE